MVNSIIHSSRFELPPFLIEPEGSVLVFDKPYGCTSFDLVSKVKRTIRKEWDIKLKVGHAGTLDPLATGILIVCVGKYTKRISEYQAQEKEYTGTFHMGATTPSYDMEKPADLYFDYSHITEEAANRVARQMTGIIEQIPPQYSAVRISGKRAFDYARAGEEVNIQPKRIEIKKFEITRFELPEIDFRIVCSKGTYIRSVARDFGEALESGAYLSSLRRTRIGDFKIGDALQCIIMK